MEVKETEARDRAEVDVNGQRFDLRDFVVSGRDVLTASGHVPASGFLLILARRGRTRLIGPDDKIDMREERGAIFRASPGDQAYTFTLDEVGQVWGAEAIEVTELLALWPVAEGRELVLERGSEPDVVLREGGVVSFAPGGVEHIVSRPKRPDRFVLVSVFATAGVFPAEGALRVKVSTPVSEVIARAAKALGVVPGTDWIVTAGERDINPGLTFEQNGLSGTVELGWGPREGGGGA